VSQDGILQRFGSLGTRWSGRRPADWQSAIRQIANLRYPYRLQGILVFHSIENSLGKRVKLKIDHHEVELDQPISIWKAARDLGIHIPTLCYEESMAHFTSCMICMVKEKKSGRLLPACSAPVADGMEIETHNDEIRAFRKSTLELLLSDHVGDCEAPCQRVCPIHAEIPRLIRAILTDQLPDAIRTVRRDMAIPSILERFCNMPCERGCRRGKHDEPLSIRELVRHVADWDLRRESPFVPATPPASGKRVAVIGAGATGLATAHYLALQGHGCTVYEKTGNIGGRIEAEFKRAIEDWVLEGELKILRQLGVTFHFEKPIADAIAFAELQKQFDAIVLACGKTEAASLNALGLPATDKGLKVNFATGATDVKGVFAGGSILKPGQPIIKSVGAAKEMAACVDQFLRGAPLVGVVEKYNHNMGRMLEGELEVFLAGAAPIPRVQPPNVEANGFASAEAARECTRCLHCDCRAKDDCTLRIYSDEYGAKQSQFAGEIRGRHTRVNQNAGAIYEPGKCIKCGLCVRVTERAGEQYGFTYVGRGFDVKIGVPLNKSLEEGLGHTAAQVIAACPTGALAKDEMPPVKGG
jgi:hypothetical protein